VQALDTGADLDDYTFRVAGCVGEFWTHICRAHLFPQATLEMPQLLADAVRFGKGLQLVNILRDIPSDLRRGRCYLPARELGSLGLRPEDLLEPRREVRLRPVYDRWLDRAEQHLEAGWRYTLALPRTCMRVRLACAWPILIGIETCGRLRTERILDPDTPVKVSRGQVRLIMGETLLRYPVEAWWSRMFERHRHKPGS
jgi:farnesyl-diphosphate farnesyltransferase